MIKLSIYDNNNILSAEISVNQLNNCYLETNINLLERLLFKLNDNLNIHSKENVEIAIPSEIKLPHGREW